MTGRPPKPVEQKRLEGRHPGVDSGGRPLPEPILIGGRVKELADIPCPPEVQEPEARALWDEFVGTMANVGMLDLVDIPALALMVTHYAIAMRSLRVLRQQGYFAAGSTGQMTVHPAYKLYADASDRYLRIANEYGGTALARARLGLAEVARKSLAAELERTTGSKPRAPEGTNGAVIEALVTRVVE